MAGILNSEEMGNLVTLVEEAARSTEEGVKHFVEPAPNTLRRATNKRHHVVFGRRGSGKSSLLRKAAADLTIDRRPIAHVNLESFKGHSYPDVLMSVLIATFREFKKWMDTAAIHPSTRTSFWNKLFGTTPKRSSFNRKEAQKLSEALSQQIDTLTKELHRTDDAELTLRAGMEKGEKDAAGANTKVGISGASAEANVSIEIDQRQKEEIEERFRRSKIDFLHRNIMEYQNLYQRLGEISGGDAYLFLDDLYHIRRTDQAQMIDYFHRIAKDHNLWLKIGTIRHR
ncbi:MAG: hypothetical protein M8357_12335, partial [Desulfobulbaceae bacterium]|nr:hypothetical protein [Desulfobulbaceae bacterium]